jgi:hypothetical protein
MTPSSTRAGPPVKSNSITHNWTLPIVNLGAALFLCAAHVRAENQQQDGDDDVWTRLSSGPKSWNTMDKIFFWSLIMVALELLNYLCGKSGGKKCRIDFVSVLP